MLIYHRVRINSTTGELYVNASLDYENVRSFIVRVMADNPDGVMDEMRVTRCDINITLQDVNDNRPMFTETEYIARVFENQDISSILTVRAIDRDSSKFKCTCHCHVNNVLIVTMLPM